MDIWSRPCIISASNCQLYGIHSGYKPRLCHLCRPQMHRESWLMQPDKNGLPPTDVTFVFGRHPVNYSAYCGLSVQRLVPMELVVRKIALTWPWRQAGRFQSCNTQERSFSSLTRRIHRIHCSHHLGRCVPNELKTITPIRI